MQLKNENSQIKKYLEVGNNINVFEKLIKENNNLKKEIKELTSQNLLLKMEQEYIYNDKNNKDMISELKKKNLKNLKNSLSDYNIFNKYILEEDNGKNNINSSTLINTGNNIIINKNKNNVYNKNINNNTYDVENNYMNVKQNFLYKQSFLLKKINNIHNGKTISNNKNNKRFKSNNMKQKNYSEIKSNYKINYNNINLAKLGIKSTFYNNNNIIESLKRLQILEDLSKKNELLINMDNIKNKNKNIKEET